MHQEKEVGNHSCIVEFHLYPQGSVKSFLCLKSVCMCGVITTSLLSFGEQMEIG